MAGRTTSSRFTLLDIEDGEEYLEDFAAFYYPPDVSDSVALKTKRKGRLRLCTRSLVFEPVDNYYPLIRIPFRETEVIARLNLPPTNPMAAIEMVQVSSRTMFEMKENNTIAPYVTRKVCVVWVGRLRALCVCTDVRCLA
jgi:factor associated with neutral sphingomyelinase activation